MKIYVGNLSRDVTEEDLKQAFGAFGQVQTVNVLKDKFTGEPRGFGFVEMASPEEAKAAIAGMNGQDLKGRALKVNEALPPKTDKGGGFKPRGRQGGGRPGGFKRGGGGGGRPGGFRSGNRDGGNREGGRSRF